MSQYQLLVMATHATAWLKPCLTARTCGRVLGARAGLTASLDSSTVRRPPWQRAIDYYVIVIICYCLRQHQPNIGELNINQWRNPNIPLDTLTSGHWRPGDFTPRSHYTPRNWRTLEIIAEVVPPQTGAEVIITTTNWGLRLRELGYVSSYIGFD